MHVSLRGLADKRNREVKMKPDVLVVMAAADSVSAGSWGRHHELSVRISVLTPNEFQFIFRFSDMGRDLIPVKMSSFFHGRKGTSSAMRGKMLYVPAEKSIPEV